MKWFVYSLLVTVLLVSLVLGYAKSAPAAPPIVLKMVTFQDKAAEPSVIAAQYAELVNERAKGELKIDYVGGPEVIPVADQPKAVKSGVIDMLQTPVAYYKPFLPEGGAHAISPYTPLEERKVGYYDWLLGLHKAKMNSYYLGRSGSISVGFNIWSKIPIARPQELVGKKTISSGLHLPFAKALGMVPVTLEHTEHYTALQQGLVDMTIDKVTVVAIKDLYDVVKFVVDHEFYKGNNTLLVNLDKWNKLPKHLQDLLIAVSIEVEEKVIPAHDREVRDKSWAEVNASGKVQRIKFSPEDTKWFYDLANQCQWSEVKKAVSPEAYAKLREFLAR